MVDILDDMRQPLPKLLLIHRLIIPAALSLLTHITLTLTMVLVLVLILIRLRWLPRTRLVRHMHPSSVLHSWAIRTLLGHLHILHIPCTA